VLTVFKTTDGSTLLGMLALPTSAATSVSCLNNNPAGLSLCRSVCPSVRLCLSKVSCCPMSFFSARQHICYSALYAIARPSVCQSVCLSVTRVDQSKTVEVRITQPSPQSSPMTSFLMLDLAAKFDREDRERGRRIRHSHSLLRVTGYGS